MGCCYREYCYQGLPAMLGKTLRGFRRELQAGSEIYALCPKGRRAQALSEREARVGVKIRE